MHIQRDANELIWILIPWLMSKDLELYELGVCKYLFKCVNVEIVREATQSSHEGHYVGRTVVQLPRVIGVVRISLRDTASQLPLAR